jgi:Protein of unknown function (DUF3352)
LNFFNPLLETNMKSKFLKLAVLKFLVLGCLIFVTVAQGQQPRPLTEALLPETTVAYIQVRDYRQLEAAMKESNFGRMMRDEKVAPLVDDLYSQAKEAFADFEDQIGVAWDDIEQLPGGEICFAVIAPKRADTQFALFMDVNKESPAADNILARIDQVAEEQGGTIESEDVEDIKFHTYKGADAEFTRFQIENTHIITTDRKLAEQIVDRWKGRPVEKIRPLSENRKFVTIMNRCRGTKETPPDMRLFIDPIEMTRSLSRGNVGMQTAINFLPALGLDGLLGIGGAAIFNEMDFESVTHIHALMANPRAGVLEMIALKPGDYKPEKWVPAGAASYISTSWDVPKMFAELNKMVDFFMGAEGMFKEQIQKNVNEQLEINFEEDFLPALSGRVTVVSWVDAESNAFNAQVNGLAVGLKDVEKAEKLIEKIRERIERDNNSEEERLIDDTYNGVKIYSVNNARDRERLEAAREQGNLRITVRAPEPSFAIIDDTFVFGDSKQFIETCVDTAKGKKASLAEDEEFLSVTKKMTKLLGTDMPAGIVYTQPGPTIEMLLKMAKGEDVNNLLEEQEEDNKYLSRLKEGLKKNPIPDYNDVKDYFKASGGFITADDTGYHWLQFQLKSDK